MRKNDPTPAFLWLGVPGTFLMAAAVLSMVLTSNRPRDFEHSFNALLAGISLTSTGGLVAMADELF